EAVLDAVFHQRLQEDGWNHDIQSRRIKMLVHTQLVAAKTHDLNIQIVVHEFNLFTKLHEFIMLAQQTAQDFRKLYYQLARAVGIKAHERGNGIQGIEEKVRIDLALQGIKTGLQQKALLYLQLHLNAGKVPDFDWNRDGCYHRGKHRKQGRRLVDGKDPEPLGRGVLQFQPGGLQGDDHQEEGGLPFDTWMAQITLYPAIDAEVNEWSEGPYLF